MMALGLIMEGLMVLVVCVLMLARVANDRYHDQIWHELEIEQTVSGLASHPGEIDLNEAA